MPLYRQSCWPRRLRGSNRISCWLPRNPLTGTRAPCRCSWPSSWDSRPITSPSKVTVADGCVHVDRQTESGYDEVVCPLPAVVTVTAGVVEPRYPSFKGIMAAKSKPVEQLTAADLGLAANEVGAAGSRQEVVSIQAADARQPARSWSMKATVTRHVVRFLEQLKVV